MAILANGRQVTIGEKGVTYASRALAAIRAEGGVEDWVRVTMAAMYQGRIGRASAFRPRHHCVWPHELYSFSG
jgi:hypothetical protein